MRPLAVLAAAAALVTAATVPYVRSRTTRDSQDGGHCLGWPAGTVEFRENVNGAPGTGDAGFAAMERSLATWEAQMEACGNLMLRMGPRITTRVTGFNSANGASNENVLLFRTQLCSQVVQSGDACLAQDNCGNVHDCWDFAAGTLAVTTTTYNPRTGKMYDADLEMNATVHLFTTVDSPPCGNIDAPTCVSTDVQNTVTHELGHALGLAHSPDPRSTMFAGAERGETSKRVLDDGSMEFVCTAYHSGGPTLDCDGTPIDLSDDPPSCASTPMGPFALLVLLLGRRRRERGEG